jgi:restriction endonuclease S subunit
MSWERLILKEILKQAKTPIQILKEKEYKLVTISNNGSITLRKIEKGIQISAEKAYAAKKGAFIYSRLSIHNGAFGIVPDDLDGALITSEMPIFDINANTIPNFLIYSLKLPSFKLQLNNLTKGMGRTRVKEDSFLSLYIDIPSIDEQNSIINEIADKEQLVTNISKISLYQLDLLKQLRQQILQDAVQGKLVPQDTNDEPASVLLERIKAEKEKLVQEKKIKKEKPLPPIKPEEIPFEIPENWMWCRLSDIGIITGGGTPSMANPEFWNGEIPWISPKDMIGEYIIDTEMKVTPEGIENSSAKRIPKGSLIIVGRSGILKRKLPVAINVMPCTVNQDMKVIIPYLCGMNRYLQLMLFGMERIVLKDFVKFGMTVHSLKYDEFAIMPIPLPPISEQYRIVTKIEQLMTLCDELEQSVQQNQKYTQELLQVALKEALEQKIE